MQWPTIFYSSCGISVITLTDCCFSHFALCFFKNQGGNMKNQKKKKTKMMKMIRWIQELLDTQKKWMRWKMTDGILDVWFSLSLHCSPSYLVVIVGLLVFFFFFINPLCHWLLYWLSSDCRVVGSTIIVLIMIICLEFNFCECLPSITVIYMFSIFFSASASMPMDHPPSGLPYLFDLIENLLHLVIIYFASKDRCYILPGF